MDCFLCCRPDHIFNVGDLLPPDQMAELCRRRGDFLASKQKVSDVWSCPPSEISGALLLAPDIRAFAASHSSVTKKELRKVIEALRRIFLEKG